LLEQKHGDFKDFLPKFWRFLGKEEKQEGNIGQNISIFLGKNECQMVKIRHKNNNFPKFYAQILHGWKLSSWRQ
jgi:hypothetical protein